MVMSPEDFKEAYAGVIEAVNNGVIAKERIDDSLLRIYKVKFKGKSVEEINALVSE
jgi:beta-N-acetylhexosaminidase